MTSTWLLILLCSAIVLSASSCTYARLMWGVAVPRSIDWNRVQAAGGIAVGDPRRDSRGHVILPVRCNPSGTETITVRPTDMNSFAICASPRVRIRANTVYLTVRTRVASGRNFDPDSDQADLGVLPHGRYAVFYLSPDGRRNPISSIQVPQQ